MAVKGQILKKDIQAKILEAFPGSFLYNDGKEIRICGNEDGAEVQVKVTLTAAKVNVSPDGEVFAEAPVGETEAPVEPVQSTISAEMTAEEQDNILKMKEFLKNF